MKVLLTMCVLPCGGPPYILHSRLGSCDSNTNWVQDSDEQNAIYYWRLTTLQNRQHLELLDNLVILDFSGNLESTQNFC
jgi:hypothetical protein